MAVAVLTRRQLAVCSGVWPRVALFVSVVVFMIVCLHSVRVSFLSARMPVAVAVRRTTGSMIVSDVVEEHKTSKVRSETKGTDDENKLGLRYLLRFNNSLNGFKEYGET
jgi:hypothetical protein